MAWRIGVDIGGTFTDVALVDDASGRIGVAKVPTTPGDLAEGVLSALEMAMSRYEVAPAEVGLLSHATTVVTNAILEEKGAARALITTRGFRDVLELRRSARADLYDLFQDAPATLIPRRRRFEITERVGADGAIVTPLAENEIDGLIAALKAARVDAVAVSLLFSFLNPAHERRLGARLRAALPDVPVYLSSEVLPEIKEFERTSTTAVCAYVGPILASYLERLEQATRSRALPPLYLMGSNGGILEAAEAIAMPAMAVESGPAAGVVAAALVARQTGRLDLLSFDMGGTTAKASLIRGGQYETTPEYEVGGGSSGTRWMNGTGHPIRVPVIDLAEVSAAAARSPGSTAPARCASARRAPAPIPAPCATPAAAPSRRSPTATSCSAIWTRIAARRRPADRSWGSRSRGPHAARRAARGRCAHRCGRRHRRRQSRDGGGPEDRVGAARPRSARFRARRLRRRRAAACGRARRASSASPRSSARRSRAPSRRSAWSAPTSSATTCAPFHHHRHRRSGSLEAAFVALEREGAAMLDRAGVAPERRRFERSVDARYARQSYELAVPVPPRAVDAAALSEIAEAFHDRHLHTYGHDNRSEPVQLVSVRLAAIGTIPPLVIRDKPAPSGTDAVKSRRQLWFRDTGAVDATIYDRRRMPAGLAVPGPAVIESLESTILVPPGWQAKMNEDGFVLLTRSQDGEKPQ